MSKTADQDIAFIRALAEILRESDLAEIEVARDYGNDDELTVRILRSRGTAPAPTETPPPAPADGVPAAPADAPTVEPDRGPARDFDDALTSPMVGTVYLTPEPGADPFVEVGNSVTEGQTVLIIEAMKTMNQIPAPRSGIVREILVANAEPVEFGAPLMIIA